MKTLTENYTVTDGLLAAAMGSGDLPVLATPAMVAMMENCCMKLVKDDIDETETTVGSAIETSHLRPSPVGATITVEARLVAADGRRRDFTVVARDGENVIGEAKHTRFVVNREKFVAKLGK